MFNAFGPRKPLFGAYTYRAKQDSNGKWFVHCLINDDWAPLYWADGVTSHYQASDFLVS